jgi:hypothetical protein
VAPVAMVRLEGVAHAVDQKCAVREVVQLVMEPLMAQFGLRSASARASNLLSRTVTNWRSNTSKSELPRLRRW